MHVLTKKGKGYDAALKQPGKISRHRALRRRDRRDAPAPSPARRPHWQDVFGQTMVKLCQKDNTIVGITAAMPSGTGLKILEKAMPDRYYDVGIAEEHAVLFAGGMATMGFHPVCAIYSTFLQRAYDCIIHDVALAGFAGDFLHGSRRAFAAGRPDASRLVRHRLSALRAERHRHGAQGRGRTGRT